MIDLHCQQCRKTLLKTTSYSYSQANDSVDGTEQVKCPRCGMLNWFADYGLRRAVYDERQGDSDVSQSFRIQP